MRPKPPQNNENWFCYFAYFSAVTPSLLHLLLFSSHTLPSAHRLLAKSVVAPPVVVWGEGKRLETEGFWQKTLAFYCPCYCCCIYLAAVKAVEECTFLRLSRFCVLPAPLSPNHQPPLCCAYPKLAPSSRHSFYSCLC